ncbi:MAG: phosphoribosyl-ATP diphosphatase [Gammaproteobacteria bacterium]|nr:phosphoribosyl-ATP diphosphatase [Gammaproteobacteria bacterium]MCY4198292.1 phosphoribosyl-ATP diphosphatase [Gammaproteobacteria bacterium]MCY4276449.1 phosphoribosyl-ATP diphosphatase [Gammaproteobacteria bacterium]MCY4322764.1 phosphoribosyl-ATP diphosphatase [Gammaproteobacteria bacterium]
MSQIIEQLSETLSERRDASPETSYTASLLAGGLPKIRAKLEEELGELIEAAEAFDAESDSEALKDALVHEAADLWFHSMVLLVSHSVSPTLVLEALERRLGISGHDEKRARSSAQ